jgi:hypothetical protein
MANQNLQLLAKNKKEMHCATSVDIIRFRFLDRGR